MWNTKKEKELVWKRIEVHTIACSILLSIATALVPDALKEKTTA